MGKYHSWPCVSCQWRNGVHCLRCSNCKSSRGSPPKNVAYEALKARGEPKFMPAANTLDGDRESGESYRGKRHYVSGQGVQTFSDGTAWG